MKAYSISIGSSGGMISRFCCGARLLAVLVLVMLPATVRARSLSVGPQSVPIAIDTVWSTDQTINTDVVVQAGATLTIQGVTVTAAASDPTPYAGGLSSKVEIIVESGGKLLVEPGTVLTATLPGDWYGVVFLPGSSDESHIDAATIGYGTVGVTVHESSPTISESVIQYMQGDDAASGAGGFAAGIVISGTSSAQVISNTITLVWGGEGVDGTPGLSGGPGAAGVSGGSGGNGGNAYGIWVGKDATSVVRGNTITLLFGGMGGLGGDGGSGGGGWVLMPDGQPGGAGGDGGEGGNAIGVFVTEAGAGCLVRDNSLSDLYGGSGSRGGWGGPGGAGFDSGGGSGGDAGAGGSGGTGGFASAVEIIDASPTVQDNVLSSLIAGGDGGAGWDGGVGGSGGSGASPTGGFGQDGGTGGAGGAGGAGGVGGDGGLAFGISIFGSSTADVRHNLMTQVSLWGGTAGIGGAAGAGGDGGLGGNGDAGSIPGNGGVGGAGGVGGSGGRAGSGGTVYGIYVSWTTPTLARNQIAHLRAGGSFGPGGAGGDGGPGGAGGDAGGAAGVGGSGGIGGAGGSGGAGTAGGWATGIFVSADHRVENNLIHDIASGDSTDGGAGGTGGGGGVGGWPNGGGGDGGDGGLGGDGGNAGTSEGIAAYGSSAELLNNTVVGVAMNFHNSLAGSGGLGGSGGTGDGIGGEGSPGASGGDGSNGYQGPAYGIHIQSAVGGTPTIVNNILANPGVGDRDMQAMLGGAAVQYGICSTVGLLTPDMNYNDIYGWDTGNYYDVAPGSYDMYEDPLFVDTAGGDFHLDRGSPCVDAGTSSFFSITFPTDDVDGDGRPISSKIDLGADEAWLAVYFPLVLK